jgi:hypothetical protein
MSDADVTADDAEHTLAMLDAGTFDLHLTAARQRLSAPGRAARPRPRRRRGRGRRHPPRDCVVTVWCPACGERHAHGWPWDSVEPGVAAALPVLVDPRLHTAPGRKLSAHLDAGPRSPATTDAAQEPVPPGRGRRATGCRQGTVDGLCSKAGRANTFRARASMREFLRLMNLQGVHQHVFDNHRRRVDAGENAQNPIDSNARSRPGSSS